MWTRSSPRNGPRSPRRKVKTEKKTFPGLRVGGESRVLTKNGPRCLEDLAGQTKSDTEIWTGCQWAAAKVFATKENSHLYCVSTNDGIEIAAGKEQAWVMFNPSSGIYSLRTLDLGSHQTYFPSNFPLPALPRSKSGRDRHASRLARETAESGILSPDAFKLSQEQVYDFISAWLDEKDGRIITSRSTAQSVVQMLAWAGIGPCTLTNQSESFWEVHLPTASKSFFDPSHARCFLGRANPAQVGGVEKKSRGVMFTITFVDPQVTTAVVEGFVLLTKPPNITSSDSSSDSSDMSKPDTTDSGDSLEGFASDASP